MADKFFEKEYIHARLINRILRLYYHQGLTQSEIASRLGLSAVKVNRLLQHARRHKMVEFIIHTPSQRFFDMEVLLQQAFALQDVWVVPNGTAESSLRALGAAGASFLTSHLKEHDVIAIGGGTTVHALIESILPDRKYGVEVVPMVGGIQGSPTTDVNYLASRLGERLGGRAFQLYSPAFVETLEQRDALIQMAPVKEILDIARRATIAVFGIGTLDPVASRFVEFTALTSEEMKQVARLHGGVGESLAIVYGSDGKICAPEYADRVVGLTFDELAKIPIRIGVAGTKAKTEALYGALRGGILNCLVTDEEAAEGVINCLNSPEDRQWC